MILALLNVGSYLVGSIPFGLYMGKMFCGVDLREKGSGNIGATNAWRVLGWKIGLPVFVLDLAKGFVPVLAARRLGPILFPSPDNTGAWDSTSLSRSMLIVSCGILAILGHNFSPFLKFKGGKGVATSLGVCIGMSWKAGVAGFVVWGILVLLTGYVSIGSIIGTAAGSLGIWLDNSRSAPFAFFGIIATLFVAFKHKANIQRLLKGMEPKVSFGKKLRPDSAETAAEGEK